MSLDIFSIYFVFFFFCIGTDRGIFFSRHMRIWWQAQTSGAPGWVPTCPIRFRVNTHYCCGELWGKYLYFFISSWPGKQTWVVDSLLRECFRLLRERQNIRQSQREKG